MQDRLDLEWGHGTPAAVWRPVGSVLTDAGDESDFAHRRFEAQQLGSYADLGGLRDIEDRVEVPRMCPMLFQIRRTFTVEESACPCELFAHRTWPDHRRRGSAECSLELSALDRTEPRANAINDLHKVGTRCCLPVVQRLSSLDDDRTLQPANPHDPPELDEHFGHAVENRLVDPRLDATVLAIRPTLTVEEARGPCEVVALQP